MKDVAGVILAGGQGKRLGGVAKCKLRLGGKPVLSSLLDTFGRCFPEVIISTRSALPYLGMGVPLALDQVPNRSSLAGIHGGLSFCIAPHAFVSPCDAPFIRTELIHLLLSRLRPETDVVVPVKQDGYMEPLCAIYSRRCVPHIKKQLDRGDNKIIRFFDKMNVVQVPEAELRTVDPELDSFINLNTPPDVKRAALKARELRLRQGKASG